MSHCHASLLPSRAVLVVGGTDAGKFLQGLITNDIGKVQGAHAIHAGLLSPQGKILFDFFVVAEGDRFLVEVARDKAEELSKRLAFYRLRAAVEIDQDPSRQVAACWGDIPKQPVGAIVYADPRLPALGYRIIMNKEAELAELGCAVATEKDYHAFRIGLGVPEGGRDYAFGDTFPHEALFDQLGGVDFEKGCFIGQEVVSRMEHRGTARKRIVPVESRMPLPAPGTNIEAGGMEIGTLGSVSGSSGLALVRLDRVEDALARGQGITADGKSIVLRRPAFARFAVPAMEGPA
jgi:tRNA-modifying protein YgfZ